MRRVCIILIGLLFVSSIGAEEWKTGLNFGLDAVQAAIGVELQQKAEISLEAGTAWERDLDYRMDDARFALNFRYILPLFNKVEPHVKTGINLLHINTGYTAFWTPGFEIGLGLGLPIGKSNKLFLEGGWQYASKEIISSKNVSNYEVLFNELWDMPPFFLNMGWRISLWSKER